MASSQINLSSQVRFDKVETDVAIPLAVIPWPKACTGVDFMIGIANGAPHQYGTISEILEAGKGLPTGQDLIQQVAAIANEAPGFTTNGSR